MGVDRKILTDMDAVADDLRQMRFLKVNVSKWTDIRESIAESNDKRRKLKERLIHYYNACKSMEAKFIGSMEDNYGLQM